MTTRDYSAEYRTLATAARNAATFSEQGAFSIAADGVLDDADAAGVDVPIGDIHDEIERANGVIA